MKSNLTTITGRIARRVLVNYRVEPKILRRHLPSRFRPKLLNGFGMAGICLIRLEEMRPRFAPSAVGLSSENAAHRIAVEWDEGEETREGVYIPIRHTNSRLNVFVGGRFFPGEHRHAQFWTAETANRVKVEVSEGDSRPVIRIAGRLPGFLPDDSVFASIERASEFFRRGSVGWSPNRAGNDLEGLELAARDWNVQPLAVEHCISSWFDNHQHFPAGAIEFDSALLMRNIAHEWRPVPVLHQRRKEAA